MNNDIIIALEDHITVVEKTFSKETKKIELAGQLCIDALNTGNKILIFGNGGSAADAQHIAAELIGRFKLNRRALPCIALTTDTSTITAISNDFGYCEVFVRQIEALAHRGDIIIGISTSGASKNVLTAFKKAREIGCSIIGLTGDYSTLFDEHSNITLSVASDDTARIQEMHILIGHILCEMIEKQLC